MPQSKKYNTKKHMGIRMFNYKNQPLFDNVAFLANQYVLLISRYGQDKCLYMFDVYYFLY